MGRRKLASVTSTHVGDHWALGRRYRRLSARIRKPIAISVVMAVLVALTGPAAFADDSVTDPTTGPTTTESASPDASIDATDPGTAPSSEPVPAPSAESPSVPAPTEPSPEPSPDSTAPPIASPTITSDKDDYPPGADVILTGANWQPGELVHIRVNDDQGMTWRRDVDVSADGNGSIRDDFRLPDWFVAVYAVTATGPASGTATTTFTDANVTAATVSIRTAASATACTAISATSFTAGDRACARSSIASLSNNNPGQTGDMYVLWVNPSGSLVGSAIQHTGATGATFDDTLVVSATGTWTVKVCTNSSCPANQVLISRTFVVNAATVANTSTTASNAVATYGNASVNLSATVSPNTVNVGTVTFTINGSTATSGTVTGGAATASFPLSAVNAGTYTIAAAYSGGTGFNASNNSAQSPAPTLTVGKADATCEVTGYSVTYDGDPHTATGSCKGVGGADLSADLDLSGTTHTAAGTYLADEWSFTDTSGNYNDQDSTVDDSIGKADATCEVTGYSVTYDGDPHTATGTCTGVEDETLSGLDLSGTTHTDAGDYSGDAWSFTDTTGNYHDQAGTVDDNIGKADAECSIFNYHLTYDAAAHTATGWCTGVEDETLSGLDLSGTTHTDAGDYSGDAWSFTDTTGNYHDQNGTVDDLIDKADASCSISGYSGVYDADAHGATGSCEGVGGEDAGTLDLGDSFTDVPGGTANWSFTGNGNYNDQASSVDIEITKADATCEVTGYSVTYDGDPHTATGTCTGVGRRALSGLDLSGTTHHRRGGLLGGRLVVHRHHRQLPRPERHGRRPDRQG